MNKRFGGMVGMTVLMGLAAIGLGGALFLNAHAPGVLTAAAPRAERGPLVAFSADNAALAGLLAQHTAMGATVSCSGVDWQLNVMPNPVKPASSFTLSLTASQNGTLLRVNKADFYYKYATVTSFNNWLSAPGTNTKPRSDNSSLNTSPPPATDPLPIVADTSEKTGFYDVIVEAECVLADRVTVVRCDAQNALVFVEALQVFETPAANFEVKDYTVSGQALVAAGDWVPLLGFNMKYSETSPAPRTLTKFNFQLRSTGAALSPPSEDMFRDFALFKVPGTLPSDSAAAEAEIMVNQIGLVTSSNALIHDVWDSHGWPYEMPVNKAQAEPPTFVQAPNGLIYRINDVKYSLNFCLDTTSSQFPLDELINPLGFSDQGPKRSAGPLIYPESDWVTAGPGDGNSYILCARLSQSWRNSISLGLTVTGALMQPYSREDLGNDWIYHLYLAPRDDNGKMVDSYSPDFYTGKILATEDGDGYVSYFDVFDPRGGNAPGYNFNQWTHPLTMYTPVPGFSRPRWDLASQTIQYVGGELMDMRQLFSVESWVNVLGINADSYSWDQPTELNLVFTDIGADPYGAPGNGGFDPREGLETFTLKRQGDANSAVGEDYAFNGVWVWYDTNANGIFDVPTPTGTAGVTFTDHPMVPMLEAQPSEYHLVNPGNFQWEYVPFPPGGGDPWWKIRIDLGTRDRSVGLNSGRRRNPPDTPEGYMVHPPKDPTVADYFVTMRADSGFKDISTLGDSKGIRLGADMRVFIEPRRWNPIDGGHWDGGMLFRSQMLALMKELNTQLQTDPNNLGVLFPDGGPNYLPPTEQADLFINWQDFSVWQTSCPPDVIPCPEAQYRSYPWWTERTHTQDTVKPLRCGLEVHDLVLTYSSDNRYGKITPIMAGQNLYRFLTYNMINPATGQTFQNILEDRPIMGHMHDWPQNVRRSELSIWTDPAFIDYQLTSAPGSLSGLPDMGTLPFDGVSNVTVGGEPGVFDNAEILLYFYFGLNELRSPSAYNAGVTRDLSAYPVSSDSLTDIQYAFETVPFQLAGDGIDAQLLDPRSTFFPNPPSQPTLPRYSTWSAFQSGRAVIAWGESSQCYLASEGTNANGPVRLAAADDAEADYEDDDYTFVVNDIRFTREGGNGGTTLPADLSGKWLVDQLGGRYYILSNQGNVLHLRHGQGAYPAVSANVPDYPYQVPLGPAGAVQRGRWQIVEDTLPRGTYPRIDDWAPEALLDPAKAYAARLLKQYIAPDSEPIAMLGINVAGTQDPAVNEQSPMGVNSVTVAFWGPEFEPSQLAGLDPNGELYTSGVLLYENSSSSFPGVFDGPFISDLSPTPIFRDRIVPLEGNTLLWTEDPEPVDLDGDVKPDDMSGDGVIFLGDPKNANDVAKLTSAERAVWDGLSDLAWVLELRPRTKWILPYTDARVDGSTLSKSMETGLAAGNWPDFWAQKPTLLDLASLVSGDRKGLSPTAGNPGDDLFVVVRTSREAKAFAEFRAVVPATLPSREPASRKVASVQISPRNYDQTTAAIKQSPEEGPVQDFYGHDMLPASVYTRVTDLTSAMIPTSGTAPVIQPGGLEAGILGIDTSVNRPDNMVAKGQGAGAQTNTDTFTVADADVTAAADSIYYRAGQGWTSEAVGLYLIGFSTGDINNSRIEGYQITAVNGRQLTLRAGAPRTDKPWYVVKDPTFLEQVVVELYDFERTGNFDPQSDLLPLNYEDPFNGQYSGLALYRDNDTHPQNRNGVFDPPIRDASGAVTEYIDLPVRLDSPPFLIGTVGGEPEYQVKFVFSTPGTDNLQGRTTVAYASQSRNRQWVPQTAGLTQADADFGPDFFVVVRPSNTMALNDRFQAAIVSWGPNTPSEPDPDNFCPSLISGGLPGQNADEFDKFSEFPWGNRAIGYITMFQKPQPIYYWGFDKMKGRVAAREDVDRSQDASQDGTGSARAARNWVRTNPALAARTLPITSLQPPQLDFVAVPTRQVVNANVAFTLLGITQVTSVTWDFGDGQTSTEINPTHQYAATGFYTVQVTVVNQFGIRNTARKVKYIEIIDAPFADFTADPVRGTITPGEPTPALAVTFTDSSISGDSCSAIAWSWNFGDGTTSTEQNPVHRYTAPGIYTVTLETTFQCSDGTVVRQRKRENYVTVLPCVGCNSNEGEGEGEGTDIPTADITFTTLVKDKEAVVPLSDWVQLFRFTMSYGEDVENYAPRVLRSLRYYICPDGRPAGEVDYANGVAPYPTDLLEFAVFKEGPQSEDALVWGPLNGVLDPYMDTLLFKWNNLGAPAGAITAVQEGAGIIYTMNFIGSGTPANPQFRLEAAPTSDDYPDGNSYIVAVRTSATWRSTLTMGVQVLGAQMVIPSTGGFPVDDEGKPKDSYSPNFYDGETLEDKQYYSSSFGAYDFTGNAFTSAQTVTTSVNAWNYPAALYMPLGEFSRPRWNAVGQALQVVSGELLQPRVLTSLDDWRQVIGINLHSTRSVHFEHGDWDARGPQLREVNVILTDIGGDPYGAPGNGGFNPRDGLKPLTTELWGSSIIDDQAYAKDVTYNGIWVWNDTNNNGIFDPPKMNAAGGITFSGDYPMLPADVEYLAEPKPSWEYIALPPGGGDPWWKISLRLIDGTRKQGNLTVLGSKEGFVEAVPEDRGSSSSHFDSEWTPDYFVVIRTDSGFKDASLDPGDGGGIAMGADFRAFIEPRHVDDPVKGTSVGGVFVDSMIPPTGNPSGATSYGPWQNDTRWLPNEPWWPQRTMNQNSAKPLKVGVEVHDLALTYESQSSYRRMTDLFYIMSIDLDNLGQIDTSTLTLGGYTNIGIGPLSGFDQWVDPFGLEQKKFQNGHTVDVNTWRLYGTVTLPLGTLSIPLLFNDTDSWGQYAYETVPFFSDDPDIGDLPPTGPRSTAYTTPAAQPTLPTYATWSRQLRPGELPRASQWTPENTKARLLTQKIDANSYHTAMLGVNMAGSSDPVVTTSGGKMTMAQLTVAFWGPDFTPDIFKSLNPANNDNQSVDSGVLLWEDTDNNGVFLNTQELAGYQDGVTALPLLDTIVPVTNLAWPSAPELVDINGDGIPDDLSGDGVVDDTDRAWVLTFYPKANWVVPYQDASVGSGFTIGKSAGRQAQEAKPGVRALEVNGTLGDGAAKALDPATPRAGDDLFITVSTSEKAHRFQQLRAFVPATLPTRAETLRKAGIQFYPQVNTSSTAFVKSNPDEDPVQDFFGMDVLETNVPLRLVDMTNRHANIDIAGAAVPVLGIDAATNIAGGTLASGDGGIGLSGGFRVPGAGWTADAYKGDWLVDSGYETYEITGNVADELTLLSGTPRNGKWRIVRDPSFLEEAQVELYVEQDGGSFNPLTDLLPLDIDQRISGVALYRDNDNHPDNRNGIYDPDIDIPIALDAAPRFVGQTAEDIQVKFVFSTPGTDDYPLPRAAQTRHRQWVQDTFGSVISDTDYGPDFFIVVRAAQGMQVGDKFRAGFVCWGPNTPTEPDPDTWAALPGEDRNDFTKFREFPWSDRGVGFVSFVKNPPKRYFMDGAIAGVRDDNSGYNWIRSHSAKKRRTGIVEGRVRPVGPTSLVVSNVSERQIPSQTLPGESFPLIIYGSHFGTSPIVVLSGYDVVINSVSDDAISISISTRSGIVPQEPVVLLVRNPITGEEVSRSDLFTIVTGSALRRPKVLGVSPAKGTRDVFPVVVNGENFGKRENIQVKFGQTYMPVLDVSADGTMITVAFPTGGLPSPGKLDVTVRDASKNLEDVLLAGFEYENQAVKKKFFGLFACSGGGAESAPGRADAAVLLGAVCALFAARRRGAAKSR